MNERRLTERLLLVDMLITTVDEGASNQLDPETVAASKALHAAKVELTNLAPSHARLKIMRRVEVTLRTHVAPHVPFGVNLAVYGLAVYSILEHLLGQDYFVIGAESELMKALDLILPALQPAADDDQKLARGILMGSAIFTALRNADLFRGTQTF